MSFFSRSSSDGHSNRHGHHGSKRYQRKGILGDIINVFGSRSSCDHYPNSPTPYPNPTPVPNHPGTMPLVVCNRCNAQLPVDSRFCSKCGAKLNEALFCGSCGEKLPADAKFCLKCGAKISG